LGVINDHKEVLDRYKVHEEFWRPIYLRGQQDVDFALGDGKQWDAKIRAIREKNGQPCLEENRMLPFVNQTLNNIRQSRLSIIPKPVDDKADPQTAEICRGLIRNIETQSDASTVYDTAARNSTMASVGWIRVCTCYANPMSFDQEIRYERIQNFQSVMLDPTHQRQDGSDAEDGFVFDDLDEEEFKSKHPNAKFEGFPKEGEWKRGSTIRVAEYFKKEHTETEIVEYVLVPRVERQVALADEVPPGATELRRRKTTVTKVKHRKLSGAEFLSEEKVFPGIYIPLVPVYGFEVHTDGGRTFYSLIHQGKDPQRALNYWISANTETTALQPKTPFVGPVGSFSTYAAQWAAANQENYPTLEYDPVTVMGDDGTSMLAPPPQRSAPPTPSPGMTQEIMRISESIKASLGIYDPSMGKPSNEISGKAIISRQLQGDNATFHFVDNLAVGIRHVGRITIGIIPIVYTGQRTIRILGEDGTESLVPLGRPVVKIGKGYQPAPEGQEGTVISFDAGEYDVVVEVGASFATKRQEMANLLMEATTANPALFAAAGDLLFKSLDVPGAEEIAKRIRATMDPALLGDDVEAQRLQMLTKALKDVQDKLALTEEALLAKKNNEEFKNSLEAKKVENDTRKIMIDAAKTEAEIKKIESEIATTVPHEALGTIAVAIRDLKAQLDDASGAIHVLLSQEEEEGTGGPDESPGPIESTVDAGSIGSGQPTDAARAE